MPLITDTDNVRTNKSSTVEAHVNAVKANVSGRLISSTQFVPLRLDNFSASDGFTPNGRLYVDDGKKSYQLGLDTLKRMNTKIVYTDDLATVDVTKLVENDYIYVKKDRS